MKQACTSSKEHIELIDVISEGRMFCIHKARKGTKYIILKSAVRPEAMNIEFLRREYELGASLSDACIVSTLGFEEDTPVGPAIILEYIEGISLDEFISKHPKRSAIDRVINDILNGVDYLHHRGIRHNDLKPSNIIITPHGVARIIDLGLSISDDSAYKGHTGGTAGYSAPEIMLGKGSSGAASDIYSIGILIKHLSGKTYRKIIERCCLLNPAERFQNIASLKRAIAFRRFLPGAVASVIFVLFILTLAFLPMIQQSVTESSHASLKNRLRTEMSTFYIPALDSISQIHTFISASAIKGEYLMQYIQFRDSLPVNQRLACEEIFAEQSAVLDSILLTL